MKSNVIQFRRPEKAKVTIPVKKEKRPKSEIYRKIILTELYAIEKMIRQKPQDENSENAVIGVMYLIKYYLHAKI